MTINELEALTLIDTKTTNDQDDEFNIPIDISDIITICREYNKLGWQIQQQVENILEVGVEESVKTGYVKKESLPHIKNFLRAVSQNPYFGDAVSQADDCVKLIQQYEMKHGVVSSCKFN
jgi:hypothetical protein